MHHRTPEELELDWSKGEVDAVVREHRPLDDERADEVSDAVAAELSALRDGDLVDVRSDDAYLPIERNGDAWDELLDTLADHGLDDRLDRLSTLRDRVERPYPSLVHLGLDLAEPFEWAPGQYVRLDIPDEEPRVYSVASSPTREGLDLVVRRVPGGELTPAVADGLAEGDEVTVHGPSGDELVLEEESPRAAVFVATGTGVGPHRGMIQWGYDTDLFSYEGEPRDVYLVYGTSWADDLAYREEWEALEREREGFHFVPTLSREATLTDWDGETAYVQHALLKLIDTDAVDVDALDLDDDLKRFAREEPAGDVEAGLDPTNAEFYATGVGAMATTVREVVDALGVDDEHLDVESYG